jgi:hypothetical protein
VSSTPLSTGGIRMSELSSQPRSTTSEDRSAPKAPVAGDVLQRAQDYIAVAVVALRDSFASFRAATRPVCSSAFAVGAPIAVHLDGVIPGAPADAMPAASRAVAYDRPLTEMAAFASVRPGTLTINGQSFDVEPAAMTLRDVAARLNDFADVSAALDEASGALTISGRRPSSPLAISDASHLLDVLGIDAGSYMPGVTVPAVIRKEPGTSAAESATQVAANAMATVLSLNRALDDLQQAAQAQAAAGRIAVALAAAVAGLRREGIDGVSTTGNGRAARLVLDREAFVAALTASDAAGGTFSGVLEHAGGGSHASAEPASPAKTHSGYEIATRLRAQMRALLNGASGRTTSDEQHAAAAATTPIASSSRTTSPVDQRPQTQAERAALGSGLFDGDGPLQRPLLPLGDDDEDGDELSTL